VHHAAHPPHGKSRLNATTTCRRDSYERHRPEDGALYQTIAAHWPAFEEEMEAQGGLPDFVRHQFERFLTCGILEHGCLHLQCRECGHSQLVAFSCKGRGVCNSCAGRRMVDAAVHLEANVLPRAASCLRSGLLSPRARTVPSDNVARRRCTSAPGLQRPWGQATKRCQGNTERAVARGVGGGVFTISSNKWPLATLVAHGDDVTTTLAGSRDGKCFERLCGILVHGR
jgi:Transposase zinc-binding domain